MAYTTINKSTDYFNTKLYTGTGSSHNITGVGFQPDWVWVKNRNINTDAPTIYDAVRGATKRLQTSSTGAESTKTNGLTAFGSDGYTAGSASAINANGSNLVSWNWLGANGTASNSDGSINSTVSANTTAGFSIVKYTGNSGGSGYSATIGHGLGVKPSCMIIKNLSATSNWAVYHKSLNGGTNPEVKYLEFNTNGQLDDAGIFYDTAPTNSVFTVGTSDKTNTVNENYIAYCFTEKTGYSKFGSYIGNGNADGTFIYTGFKPAWIMTKMSSGVQTWNIFDNRRNGYNPTERNLQASLSNAEDTGRDLDILSNGFKQRNGGAEGNGNNSTYIYMAFAEEPLVANVGQSIPATAR